jgi:glycosyltransferase involved in cell wall biosynthesis
VERADTAKIDVLYNGVDMERYARRPDLAGFSGSPAIPPQFRIVGIVANYRPVKDLPLFLRAARIVAGAVPDAAFLLVGQGPQRAELTHLAAELGIADRVFFTDGNGAVPDHIARMTVACLSSASEGFSNAFLEYMAAGLPVVATDVGGNAEAIQDGPSGYLVRTQAPEALAMPIIRLLQNESLRATMARASNERCREKFDIGQAICELEDYYVELLKVVSPPGGFGNRSNPREAVIRLCRPQLVL